MARRFFNDGMEVTFQDTNKISSAVEKLLLDKVMPQLVRGQTSRVFGQGLKVNFVDTSTVEVDTGVGFFNDSSVDVSEAQNRLLYQAAATEHEIDTPHGSNNRIDIISVKGVLASVETGTRKFKDATTSAISDVSFDLQKDWELDVVITKGVEDGSLAVPATPTGYMKLAEILVTAVSGIANQAAITDKRFRFVYEGYDAVVGLGDHCSHQTLAAAIADSNIVSGMKIKIESSETISTPVSISKTNLQLDFMPNVTFTKGGAATEALTIAAAGCRINGGRFAGFSGGGDRGIRVTSGSDYAILFGQRFASCTLDVLDDSGKATVLANVLE
jgi:hypothetical protein